MRGIFVTLGAIVALFCLVGAPTFADAPQALYLYNILGINGDSEASFEGKFPGNDMLPYTDDDIDVEGNAGGVWGVSHMDNDSDNEIDDGEPIFVTVRNNDDDQTIYSGLSRPEYGVIYESEDWVEYWEANLGGPNGEGPLDNTDLTDFEMNDHNGWTDESNAYVYNNLGANQHGLGLAKYQVDYRTTPAEGQEFVLDEIEGWQKSFTFRNTADDPETPFNEDGDCDRFYVPRGAFELKGYMIPIEDLEEIENGSLPTLFGWETVDLASYLRDTIGPLLDHEDLSAFEGDFGEQILDVTYLYLLQLEVPMDVSNSFGECGGSGDPLCANEPDPGLCQVQNHAAYWGIPGDGSGTLRQCHIMGFNSELVEFAFQPEDAVHPWVNVPEDDARLNLWHQDHFWRDDATHFGNYTLIPPVADPAAEDAAWRTIEDPGLARFDGANDQVLLASGAGAVSAPLSKALSIAETPVSVVADLALDVTDGDALDAGFQLIARSGDTVVAYADISSGGTQVHLGGSYDSATGMASGPGASGAEGAAGLIGEVDTVNFFAEYTRFVLVVSSDGASLRQADQEGYGTNDYADLAELGDEVASVQGDVAFADGVTDVTISGTGRSVVSTILVFASPGVGPFIRGDCNQDRKTDIADGVSLLNFLFGGDDLAPCLAACAASGEDSVNLSSAVYIFNFLFAGGPAIGPPVGTAAYSQRAEDFAVGCEDYSP